MEKSGPMPRRAINLLALRSRHHSEVLAEVNRRLVRTLKARMVRMMTLALRVFHAQVRHWRMICMLDAAMVSSIDKDDSMAKLVIVRRFLERRSRAARGESLPANSETWVFWPTWPKTVMAFLVRPCEPTSLLTWSDKTSTRSRASRDISCRAARLIKLLANGSECIHSIWL